MRCGNIRRDVMTIEHNDDLEQETDRSIYENFHIGTITYGTGNESMEISMPDGEYTLHPGEEVGGVNPDDLKRLLIRRTIIEHLHKEIRFAAQKREVKVLSLFFMDKVEHYRQYDADGNFIKGRYALMAEEEYRDLAKLPEYQTLFEKIRVAIDAHEVHDVYFSIDRNGGWTATEENNQTNRDSAERAYNLIMEEKEKLLSFESKLKFIFSHSALREG